MSELFAKNLGIVMELHCLYVIRSFPLVFFFLLLFLLIQVNSSISPPFPSFLISILFFFFQVYPQTFFNKKILFFNQLNQLNHIKITYIYILILNSRQEVILIKMFYFYLFYFIFLNFSLYFF